MIAATNPLNVVLFEQQGRKHDTIRIEAVSFVDRTKGLTLRGELSVLVLDKQAHSLVFSIIERGLLNEAENLILGYLQEFTTLETDAYHEHSTNWFMERSECYGMILMFQIVPRDYE